MTASTTSSAAAMTRIVIPVGWVRNTKVRTASGHRARCAAPGRAPGPSVAHRPVGGRAAAGAVQPAGDRPADAHRGVGAAGEEAGEGEHEPEDEQRPQASRR